MSNSIYLVPKLLGTTISMLCGNKPMVDVIQTRSILDKINEDHYDPVANRQEIMDAATLSEKHTTVAASLKGTSPVLKLSDDFQDGGPRSVTKSQVVSMEDARKVIIPKDI